MVRQKPFLKWVGGKTQIIDDIVGKFPSTMKNYHELFLGGGSVLFAVLSLQKEGKITIKNKIYAYDINESLINVYKHLQKEKDALYDSIQTHMTEYDSIDGVEVNRKPTTIAEAKTSKESYYYWLRSKYNSSTEGTVERSALFMVLNKLCFRGVYRVGPNGFNVPFGHYKKTPTVISRQELDKISHLIQTVEFICSDFTDSIKLVKRGDFVYADPPYAPENEKSFVGYNAGGFALETHNKLFKALRRLDRKRVKFVMSNAKVKLVTDAFERYSTTDIIARRAINSKNPESTTTEVIIHNQE